MTDINIDYLGLKLKNPVIGGACNLWTKDKKLTEAEEAGAAAIVYKSLFEEQVQLERLELDEMTSQYDERHAMMTDVFPEVEHAGPAEHLSRLKEVKGLLGIPVIASINAVNRDTWLDYSKRIEDTGVDALELNFYSMGKHGSQDQKDIEAEQISILEEVKSSVSLPISVKLSFFYDNPTRFIEKMASSGADGFVIFNRLFQPDIDIETQKHIQSLDLSKKGDYRLPLRFTGLLFGEIDADICSSSGIIDPEDVIKMLLAGATCIQTVSSLYKEGIENIANMLKTLTSWMEDKGYSKIEDFRGRLSNKEIDDPFVYQRAQYVDMLMRSEKIFKDRPV